MTDLLQFTINIRKSHRQTRLTLQLVCQGRVLYVWVHLHVFNVSSIVKNTTEKFVSCTHLL